MGHYSEDLEVGYRWYEAHNVQPVFPFGFGLSYTTFTYSNLSVGTGIDQETGRAVLAVRYRVTNTGNRRGAEASQVYIALPSAANEPSKRLVGFAKVDLMPFTSQVVTVAIDPAAPNHPLSFFEPDASGTWADGRWRMVGGTYNVHVGTSSADTPLQAAVNVCSVPVRPATQVRSPNGEPNTVTGLLRIGGAPCRN